MHTKLKLWTQLGLGTAVAGGMLAACGGEAGEQGAVGRDAGGEGGVITAPAGQGGEGGESGEGGEGGESGESGIDTAAAARDPVVYRSALAVAEAHVIAARDAHAAGRMNEAAEMFAHPVSEVLVPMGPVFAAQGVADFSGLFTEASTAVLDGANAQQVSARFDAIIAALSGAASKAPAGNAPEGKVAAGVVADQIERAVAMHREAGSNPAYEPYLDGYGFARVAQSQFTASETAIRSTDAALHARMNDALGLLAKAFPSVQRPAQPAVEQGALAAASSKVILALGS
jgi:hypothetical protein